MVSSKLVPRFSLRHLSAALFLAFGLGAAQAEDASNVQSLLSANKPADALHKADQLLAAKPGDPKLMLQRGLALTQLNRQAEAIAVFQKLTETHPELPGPYNNLAVLYAAQGDYEKARQALELAIRTNPSYATALQNLGDVYARMASQAYKKALALDKTDGALPLKLSVIQNVFETPIDPRTGKPISSAAETALAKAGAATSVAAAPATTPAPAPAPVVPKATAPVAAPAVAAKPTPTPAPVTVAKASPAPVAPSPAPAPVAAKPAAPAPVVAAAPAPVPAPAPTPAKAAAADQAEHQAVDSVLHAWAEAWSRRDMSAYVAAYSPDFKGKAASHQAWQADRQARIMGKKKISVGVSDVQIKISGDKATVRFRQDYTSDALNVKSSKTLDLVKGKSGGWLITQESSS